MLSAHMIQRPMLSSVIARRALRTQALQPMSHAQVRRISFVVGCTSLSLSFYRSDSCQVKNGGCDPKAQCLHEGETNAVLCVCKTGYTNTGSTTDVICQGMSCGRRSSNDRPSADPCADTCSIDNGGCGVHAECSHDATTNAVLCKCQTGYMTVGADATMHGCTGTSISLGKNGSAHLSRLAEDCQVNNGGCDINAKCSHDPKTYAVRCTCKTGYVNIGVGAVVVCKGH